jgi:hypothetical protein
MRRVADDDRIPAGAALPPGPLARLAGVGGIAGAVLWPISLTSIAAAGAVPPGGDDLAARSSLVGPSVASILLATLILALEKRAVREPGLLDLVGALSIGTAAGLLTISAAVASFLLLGPALMLLLGGSIVYGIAGFDGRRRPRWGSALVGIGAGGLLAFVVLAGMLGPDALGGFEQTSLLSLLLFGVGWGWFGLHLALARPLVPPSE